jgi:hypothetical protein
MTDMPRTDGPDSDSVFPAFLAGISQLGQLLHLAWAGAGTAFVAGNLSNDPRAALLGKFGEEQVHAGFPLLYEVATVRLDSILDAMVRRFIRRHAAKRPIVKRSREKLYGVDWHERQLEVRGYGGVVPLEVRRALMQLSATRDVIVHQLGRVDEQFVQCCPWLNLKIGDAVRISNRTFVSYQAASSWYAIELSRRALEAGEVEIPSTGQEHLASQAAMMRELRNE